MQPHAPGWYPDPAGGTGTRWWDGQEWTGRRAIGRRPVRLPPLGPTFAQLADLLGRLLLVNAGLSLATLVIERFVHDPAVFRSLALTALVLLLVTAVAWCAWQWRLAVSAPGRLRRTPSDHVVVWFIPVAQLWLPMQDVNELWHAYEPHDARGRGDTNHLVVPWWTCWLGSAVLGALGLRTLLAGQVPDNSLGLAWAVAALLAWFVVRRLSWRALLYHAGLA
jgi:hypothetical protein